MDIDKNTALMGPVTYNTEHSVLHKVVPTHIKPSPHWIDRHTYLTKTTGFIYFGIDTFM